MADYWVSRDKYFCKYCKIFIADDKPSRIQHETGLRHKGNYERYIRDIYKRGAKDQKDKIEESKEIARIEAAAKAAMGIDPSLDASPVASTSKTPASAPAPATTKPAKPADPYANYTTAESLGYKDDAKEKEKEEAEMRMKEGTIGQWQKVAKRPPPPVAPPVAVPTGGLLPVGVRPRVKEEEGGVKKEEGTPEGGESKPRLPNESEEQKEPKKKGYFTEKSYDLDDDFDPTKISSGGIKLKRKRLTLKEEEELERERKEREEASVPIEGVDERRTGGRGGWEEAEVKEEPMIEFEEKPVVTEREEEKPEVKPDTTSSGKPEGGGGRGFKKRKMHGAGTVRKK
ncbi:uncharacterized protein JCM6883_005925 [Sporobolomyces salmoneus]|uniref:uncharacterized protein n=1 Tax=Sporobolomyces salmoneus TaxID=183962 RepID=UPI003174F27B